MTIVACNNCGAKNRVDEREAATRQPKCGRCGNLLNTENTRTAVDPLTRDTPLIVTDATFERAVLEVRNQPVLLDCWAPWCGPCRMIAPALEQLAAESNGKYLIAKLDVDENPRVAAQFQIQSIPTMLIFKNGALIDRLMGAMPKQSIAARLLAVT